MTITDLPVLEQTQFNFLMTHPIINQLITFINKSDYMSELKKPQHQWNQHSKLARELSFNKNIQIVTSREAINEYGHDITINAIRYLKAFVSGNILRRADGVAVMAWMVEKVVDIEETAKYNNLTL